MWTRAAHAELARENLLYASSLANAEWALIAPLLPAPSRTGSPWRWLLRAILDGIQYVLRTSCAWRHLPLDFPPWFTVHRWGITPVEGGRVRAPRSCPYPGRPRARWMRGQPDRRHPRCAGRALARRRRQG